jgi:UDP-N-acetylglucosamine 2-epimerase (non-hydrolysing)
VTGNTVIDACLRYGSKAVRESKVLREIPYDSFALVTAHRAENVDDPVVLRQLVRIFTQCPVPVVYPIHPRTRERLREAHLEGDLEASENVHLLPPVGYLDFLALLMRCAFVLTDSGGIQEEATAPNVRKKAFVLRRSTERPEAVDAGFAEVVGTEPGGVLRRLHRFVEEDWVSDSPSPFGDGRAGERTIAGLEEEGTPLT